MIILICFSKISKWTTFVWRETAFRTHDFLGTRLISSAVHLSKKKPQDKKKWWQQTQIPVYCHRLFLLVMTIQHYNPSILLLKQGFCHFDCQEREKSSTMATGILFFPFFFFFLFFLFFTTTSTKKSNMSIIVSTKTFNSNQQTSTL